MTRKVKLTVRCIDGVQEQPMSSVDVNISSHDEKFTGNTGGSYSIVEHNVDFGETITVSCVRADGWSAPEIRFTPKSDITLYVRLMPVA